VVFDDSSLHIYCHDWWCLMTATFTFNVGTVVSDDSSLHI